MQKTMAINVMIQNDSEYVVFQFNSNTPGVEIKSDNGRIWPVEARILNDILEVMNKYKDVYPPMKDEELIAEKNDIVNACAEWLVSCLESGPKRVSEIRRKWEDSGHSAKTLYAAKSLLNVKEVTKETYKFWSLQ